MTTALEGLVGQRHAPAAIYPGKHPVTNVQGNTTRGIDKKLLCLFRSEDEYWNVTILECHNACRTVWRHSKDVV